MCVCVLAFRFTDGSRAEAKDINASFGATYKGDAAGTYTLDADLLAGPNFDLSGLVKYKVSSLRDSNPPKDIDSLFMLPLDFTTCVIFFLIVTELPDWWLHQA